MQGLGFRGGLRTCIVAMALALGSSHAFAQTDTERAGARAAATEGAKAFEDGHFEQAIDLFTRAESLVHAPPHLLYLARSHEKLGQLVKAREAYLKITREKLGADAPEAFRDAQSAAQQELAALEPRVPSLTIKLTGAGAESATVTMDDKPVPKALVGVPYPVDPGEHRLQASGEGVQSEMQTVKVEEGGRADVELALQPAAGATPDPSAGGSDTGASADASIDTGSTGGTNGMRIGAYAALGVGVVGVAAGTFFALRSSSKRGEADDLCTLPGGGCPAERQDEINSLDDDADSAGTLSVVSFVVGGVGIATGVTLLILSGQKESTARTLHQPYVQPYVGLGSAGLFGRF